MTLIGRPAGDRSCSRLGIVAPRRLGNAVRRNLIKRRVRELFRHDKPTMAIDLVVLPFRELPDVVFGALRHDYRRTLLRQLRALASTMRAQ
jgi:ribonuclease P protein component